jgi:outer membrane murein-binding lipoprotein Lpp
MTDAVLTAVIGGVVTLGGVYLKGYWDNKKIQKVAEAVANVDIKVDKVSKQTDGLTKALVVSEKKVSHAEGVQEGIAQVVSGVTDLPKGV